MEDGKPVENVFVEKQQRLLTEPLYASWPGPGDNRTFKVLANVGLFYKAKHAALVPDVMLSLDVEVSVDLTEKDNRSYLVWVVGKMPEVVLEIVSDRHGGEHHLKMRDYARLGIIHYVIFDPDEHWEGEVLQTFGLDMGTYRPLSSGWLPAAGLGLILWEGTYEGQEGRWLRWCDAQGELIPTGKERAEQEHLRRARALAPSSDTSPSSNTRAEQAENEPDS